MQSPLVSIIVPIYKVEPYLRRCLDSIVNQTYTNLEIILVDDGSPDGCPQICDEYATKDERIVVIHKENGGLSDARNAGLDICKGEYIYYLDGDDAIDDSCIVLMLELVNKYPEVEIVIGEMQTIPPSLMYENKRCKHIDFLNANLDIRKSFFRVKNRLPVNACNKLIKKEFIVLNNLFFKKGLLHEDELWMFHVAKMATKIAFIHKPTYYRYINPNSITTSTSLEKRNLAWKVILTEFFKNITVPASKEQLLYALNQLRYYYDPQIDRYDEIWSLAFVQLKKQRLHLLRLLYYFYHRTFPILKGRGIGFIIWLITK